ncbi:MAG: hypothetical protein Q8O67_28515 [Deltaproteobacteria bacterium]|nr:hypothetical protein [Deltaproteobacteria bacterium]
MQRFLIVLAVVAVALPACKSTTNAIRVPEIGVVARDLERDEYVVLGTVEGKSCVEVSCLLGIFCTVKDEGGNAITGNGIGEALVNNAAEEQAMLKALKAQPEADAVLAPRKSSTLQYTNAIISASIKSCVRVFGKSIRIKTDDEMKGVVAAPPVAVAPPASPPSG